MNNPNSKPIEVTQESPETPAIVVEELKLLAVVQKALSRVKTRKEGRSYDEQLIVLRDALTEEKLDGDQAAILEQMDRISALSLTRSKHVQGRLNAENPYFGHMRIEYEEAGRKDILIGKETFVADGVRVVDWRNAPISRVFYQTRQDESFDITIANREVSGEILARRTLTIRKGELARVTSPEGVFVSNNGEWVALSSNRSSLSGGEGSASRPDTMTPVLGANNESDRLIRDDKHLTEIAALLDPEQFALITNPETGVVAIQGSAGSGKTTVALHRLAYLTFQSARRYRPQRMLVLVFSESLARYISHVLPALGVSGVPVRTLHRWAQQQVQSHFSRATKKRADDTPAPVVRFKSHAVLIPMLEDAAKAHPNARPENLFDEIFTDLTWMKTGIARHAPGSFSIFQLQSIHRWCSDEYGNREIFQSAHETGENTEGVLARYDPEDDMILLRLQQLLRGSLLHKGKHRVDYDHIMVDEAQDFSPLELLVLKDCARGKSLTLAGDTAQVVYEEHSFSDWTEVLEAIGESHISVSPLAISYRSTQEIMDLAHHVLGPLAPEEKPQAPRRGAPVELLQFGGQGEALTFVADALGNLADREPRAGIAVLTRYAHQADEAYELLQKADLPNLHRVRNHDFSFEAGVEVTDIAHTKGLEFDYVVILACDQSTFPLEMDSSRHLLHIGLTRAAHQAWLISWGPPSALLPESLFS